MSLAQVQLGAALDFDNFPLLKTLLFNNVKLHLLPDQDLSVDTEIFADALQSKVHISSINKHSKHSRYRWQAICRLGERKGLV